MSCSGHARGTADGRWARCRAHVETRFAQWRHAREEVSLPCAQGVVKRAKVRTSHSRRAGVTGGGPFARYAPGQTDCSGPEAAMTPLPPGRLRSTEETIGGPMRSKRCKGERRRVGARCATRRPNRARAASRARMPSRLMLPSWRARCEPDNRLSPWPRASARCGVRAAHLAARPQRTHCSMKLSVPCRSPTAQFVAHQRTQVVP